jgi:general secretion pathway protein E
MPASLPDVLLSAAQKAGCRDQARLRHALDEAADKRQPLIEALLDANIVDEETFFSQLAESLRMPCITASPPSSPCATASIQRMSAAQEATLLTYNPFDLGARQAVGQELRKRVHWQIASRHRILEALHQGYGVGAENFENCSKAAKARSMTTT